MARVCVLGIEPFLHGPGNLAGEDHLSERYPSPTAGRWEGPGILRISPTGLPWSIWLFWDDQATFSTWYVNLESPHLRDQTGTWSEDQILDLVVRPGGTVSVKDSEDLDRAVAAGRACAADAAQIRRNAHLARDYYTSGAWPFDPEWIATSHQQTGDPSPSTQPPTPAESTRPLAVVRM